MPLSKNDVKKKLGITSWGELNDPAGFDGYLALFPEIRIGTHLRIFDEVPDYIALISSYFASVIDKAETCGAPREKIESLTETIQWLAEKEELLCVKERQTLFNRINETISFAKTLKAPKLPKTPQTPETLEPLPGPQDKPAIIELLKIIFMSFGALILIIGAWIFRIKLIESEEN